MTEPMEVPGEPWDHTYKGDAYWLRFRAEVLRLLDREVAASFADVEADPWFQKESHAEQAVQWDRARKRLVRGRPRAPGDGSDLVQFFVLGRGGRKWYLARREEMHCAAAVAAIKEHLSRRAWVANNLRAQWGLQRDGPGSFGSCPACGRVVYNGDLSGEVLYPGPVIPKHHAHTTENPGKEARGG